jgi:hypothetical protein
MKPPESAGRGVCHAWRFRHVLDWANVSRSPFNHEVIDQELSRVSRR